MSTTAPLPTSRFNEFRCPVGHVMITVGLTSETFLEQSIRAVEARGWSSYVFGLRPRGDVRDLPAERVFCPEPLSVTRRIVDTIEWKSSKLRFAEQIRPAVQERGVGLLHAHFGWSGAYAAPLARRLGIPLVVTFYGSDALIAPPSSRLARGHWPGERVHPYDELFVTASAVIAVSEYVRSALRDLGYTGTIHVIRNGVDLERLSLRAELPSLDRGLRLAFTGRLVAVKGADVLLRAMPAVLERYPDTRLEVTGDGEERRVLERLSSELGIANKVRFHGMLPHDQALEKIAAAHALVIPSRVMRSGATDSSSMVFKEALALGVPAIATRAGGLVETCPPQYRDELVPPEDPAALSRAIITLVDRRAGWPGRVATGREWIERVFSAAELGRRLSDCYLNVIPSQPSSDP